MDRFWRLLVLAALGLAATFAQPARASAADLPDCGGAPEGVCRVQKAFAPTAVLDRLHGRDFAWWIEGDTLNMVARGSAAPFVCCSVQLHLSPLAGPPGLWAEAVHLPRLQEAVLELGVLHGRPDDTLEVWRGPHAPPAPPALDPPPAWLHRLTVSSRALGESRIVYVYAPPRRRAPYPVIYMADGQSVPDYARIVHGLAAAGLAKEVVLIGLEPGAAGMKPGSGAEDQARKQEYLFDFPDGADRFARHERFLLDEVMPMAERDYGASADPRLRAVLGYSNGGAWALEMGARHPATFAGVVALSSGWTKALPLLETASAGRVYLGYGLYEAGQGRDPAREAAAVLSKRVDSLRLEVRVAGHSDRAFADQFGEALPWLFPASGPPRRRGSKR